MQAAGMQVSYTTDRLLNGAFGSGGSWGSPGCGQQEKGEQADKTEIGTDMTRV